MRCSQLSLASWRAVGEITASSKAQWITAKQAASPKSWKRYSLERRHGLERAIERDAVLVEQRRFAQSPHPLGAIGTLDEERHGADDAVELRQAAGVSVGITLHQPVCADDLDREIVVLRHIGGDEPEPAVEMLHLAAMPQCRAAHRLERSERVEQQEPPDRARAHPPAFAEHPLEPLWMRLEPGAELRRQAAGNFLEPRVHVLGGVDDLPVEHRVLM